MKLPSFKSIIVALGFVAGIMAMSSCNRGYGCPTDFSVDAIENSIPSQPAC